MPMADITFTDRTIPPGGLATSIRPPRGRGRLNLLFTLEDLGELSFYPFVIFLSAMVLTPLGAYSGIVWAVAIGISLMALQLLLRVPHIVLPEVLRDAMRRNKYVQLGAEWYGSLEPRRSLNGKRTGHWISFRPFDLIPKFMLLLIGGALPFTTEIPYMTGTLAFAAIVISIGLTLRKALVIVSGALLISASSVMPAFM